LQFSEDDRWYRARVKRASALKKECEVVFIDCEFEVDLFVLFATMEGSS